MTENEIKLFGGKLVAKCGGYAFVLNQELNSTLSYIYRTHSLYDFKDFMKSFVPLLDKLLKDFYDSLTCVNVTYDDSLKMLCDFTQNYYYSKNIKSPFIKYFDKIEKSYNDLNELEWVVNNSNEILKKLVNMIVINRRWLSYYE